jgi:hypothetical protein
MNIISIYDLKLDGHPILITVMDLVNYLKKFETKKDLVLEIFQIASLIEHQYNAYDYRDDLERDLEVHNIFKFINIYGYGVCKQFVLIMNYLLDIFEIENRVLYLGKNAKPEFDHFAIEVFLNNKWAYFDPNIGIYFTDLENNILSINDINNKVKHKIIGSFSAKKWVEINKDFSYLEDEKVFKHFYFKIFENVQAFTLKDCRFDYKKKFMDLKGIVKWYSYAQKDFYFHTEKITVKKSNTSFKIVNRKRESNSNFENIVFCFNGYNKKSVLINDFPLLIIDCKIFFKSNYMKSMVNVFINGEEYNFNVQNSSLIFTDIAEKNNNLFENPIYSFEIISNKVIEKFELLTQVSNFKARIMKYLKDNN